MLFLFCLYKRNLSGGSKLMAKPLLAFHRQSQDDVHYAAEGRLSEGR